MLILELILMIYLHICFPQDGICLSVCLSSKQLASSKPTLTYMNLFQAVQIEINKCFSMC